VLAGLHILNPDAFIVKANLDRPTAERPFDARYAATLSADAVPVLIDALPRLDAADRCAIATAFLNRWSTHQTVEWLTVHGPNDPDWRSWNWSRARARSLVREHLPELLSACPATGKGETK
jgi:hypothetical protein